MLPICYLKSQRRLQIPNFVKSILNLDVTKPLFLLSEDDYIVCSQSLINEDKIIGVVTLEDRFRFIFPSDLATANTGFYYFVKNGKLYLKKV